MSVQTVGTPQDRKGFESLLDMLQCAAAHIWTAARWRETASQDVLQSSLLLGVWQAPALLCTRQGCWAPRPHLLLRWWPLTGPEEATDFLYEGEPDGDPQAILHIGLGGLSNEERWPVGLRDLVSDRQHLRNKVRSERWGFRPDGLDPLMEERQRAIRASKARWRPHAQREREKACAQEIEGLVKYWMAQEEDQPPGPPFYRTLYLPEKRDEQRACFLMVVFLFHAGLIWRLEDNNALTEWAGNYLVKQWRCVDSSHAFLAFMNILRTPQKGEHGMLGNEDWRAPVKYIARAVPATRERSPYGDRHQQQHAPYTVKAVIGILDAECHGEWGPTRYWLYDQINVGRVPFTYDAKGRKVVDEEGLASIRERVQAKRQQKKQGKAIMTYQKKLGKGKAAARKWFQRHTKRGESLAVMAKILLRTTAAQPEEKSHDADHHC